MEIVGERVEIGTQRIGSEVLFPQSGGQLRHLAGGDAVLPVAIHPPDSHRGQCRASDRSQSGIVLPLH